MPIFSSILPTDIAYLWRVLEMFIMHNMIIVHNGCAAHSIGLIADSIPRNGDKRRTVVRDGGTIA